MHEVIDIRLVNRQTVTRAQLEFLRELRLAANAERAPHAPGCSEGGGDA